MNHDLLPILATISALTVILGKVLELFSWVTNVKTTEDLAKYLKTTTKKIDRWGEVLVVPLFFVIPILVVAALSYNAKTNHTPATIADLAKYSLISMAGSIYFILGIALAFLRQRVKAKMQVTDLTRLNPL